MIDNEAIARKLTEIDDKLGSLKEKIVHINMEFLSVREYLREVREMLGYFNHTGRKPEEIKDEKEN